MKSPADPSHIQVVVLDVDGVLTDGRVGYGAGSDDEIKYFDVRDGLGVRLLLDAGFRVGVLTGRRSKANRRRAEELGLSFVIEGCRDKGEGFSCLMQQEAVTACQCLYMGDDLIDLPVMRQVAISVAPADASPEVVALADWVCCKPGGRGAVREMAERLLKGSGRWSEAVKKYCDG